MSEYNELPHEVRAGELNIDLAGSCFASRNEQARVISVCISRPIRHAIITNNANVNNGPLILTRRRPRKPVERIVFLSARGNSFIAETSRNKDAHCLARKQAIGHVFFFFFPFLFFLLRRQQIVFQRLRSRDATTGRNDSYKFPCSLILAP